MGVSLPSSLPVTMAFLFAVSSLLVFPEVAGAKATPNKHEGGVTRHYKFEVRVHMRIHIYIYNFVSFIYPILLATYSNCYIYVLYICRCS